MYKIKKKVKINKERLEALHFQRKLDGKYAVYTLTLKNPRAYIIYANGTIEIFCESIQHIKLIAKKLGLKTYTIDIIHESDDVYKTIASVISI